MVDQKQNKFKKKVITSSHFKESKPKAEEQQPQIELEAIDLDYKIDKSFSNLSVAYFKDTMMKLPNGISIPLISKKEEGS